MRDLAYDTAAFVTIVCFIAGVMIAVLGLML